MSDGFTPEQELEAARKISEAMTLLNKVRWSAKTQAQKNAQGELMRAARKRKAKAIRRGTAELERVFRDRPDLVSLTGPSYKFRKRKAKKRGKK